MTEQDPQENSTQPAPPTRLPKNWLRNYLPMGIGQIVSLVGSALVQFSLVWYVTKQTGSATVLASATTAALLPNILLGPFVGALVDRWNRKLVMIIADLVVALATAVLAVLYATGAIQIWHIIAILLTRSAAGVFQGPARTAATTLMVPQEHLSRLGESFFLALHAAISPAYSKEVPQFHLKIDCRHVRIESDLVCLGWHR